MLFFSGVRLSVYILKAGSLLLIYLLIFLFVRIVPFVTVTRTSLHDYDLDNSGKNIQDWIEKFLMLEKSTTRLMNTLEC